MNIGNKIHELREQRGITQEQLSAALGVSPQAVSKWETSQCCPDISLLPVIAGYYGVSIDTLFEYDADRLAAVIDDIHKDYTEHFWNEPERAEKILLDGIARYPSADKLKADLIELYVQYPEWDDAEDKAVRIAEKLISTSSDYFSVSSAKHDLAVIYLRRGNYRGAKRIIDSMPVLWPLNIYDKMRCSAYMLNGADRLESAHEWKPYAHQDLFICCELEGRGYFEIGDYEQALASFGESIRTIELFLKDGKVAPGAYPIGGTQSNHCHAAVGAAACLHRLGRQDECEGMLEKAYRIPQDYYGKEWFSANSDTALKAFRDACVFFGIEDSSRRS